MTICDNAIVDAMHAYNVLVDAGMSRDDAKTFANSYKRGDKYGILYQDESMNRSFYTTAPDFVTAMKDIFAEMPSNTEMANHADKSFTVINKLDTPAYYRRWYLIRLEA